MNAITIAANHPTPLSFMSYRSGGAFLGAYLTVDPDLPGSLTDFGSYVRWTPKPHVLARLHQAGLLSEQVRRQAVENLAGLAVTTPDDGWLDGADWKILLTDSDRAMLMDKVRTDLVPRLEDLDGIGDGERDPDDDPVESALLRYERAFREEGDHETAQAFDWAWESYRQLPSREREDYDDEDRSPLARPRLAPPSDVGRSIFDDIDE